MRITEIMALPDTVNNNHESLYRSYHILQKVKELLKARVPAKFVLEIIAEIEEAPSVEK